MRYLISLFLLSSLLLGLNFGCKKPVDPINFHLGYFDLSKGRYIVYEVLEIEHDEPSNIHDSIRYELKTVIGDTVIDNQGRIARKYTRYIRANSQDQWKAKDVWTAILTDYRAELVEENQRKIKLVFAPTEDKSWDINAFNNQEEEIASISRLHEQRKINNINFGSTLQVNTKDELNQVQYIKKYEIYAEGIGLVQKYSKDFTLKIDSSTPGPDSLVPQKGSELFYTVKTYGFQ